MQWRLDKRHRSEEEQIKDNGLTLDFDEDLQGAYLHVYDWLNLELDLDDIKSARIQIAEILSEHEQEGKGE